MPFEGLTAIVTGGGTGIGFAAARLLLDGGANVVISGRTASTLEEAAQQIGGGNRLKTVVADISSEGHARNLVRTTVQTFGKLDVLINNAGIFSGAPLVEMEEDDFDEVVDINLKGTWFMCRYSARPLIDAGGGCIVNVSSYLAIRAHRSTPCSAYSAAKAGVLGLTRELAVELAPHKIRVNAVIPAVVDTPMLDDLPGGLTKDQLLERAHKAHPIGRAGESGDVARAIAFLADPANGWVTGAELTIDGGRSVI